MKWIKIGLEYSLWISALWVIGLMFIPTWIGNLLRRMTSTLTRT